MRPPALLVRCETPGCTWHMTRPTGTPRYAAEILGLVIAHFQKHHKTQCRNARLTFHAAGESCDHEIDKRSPSP